MTEPEATPPQPDPTPRRIAVIVIVAAGLIVGVALMNSAPPDSRSFLPVVFWTALAAVIAVYVDRWMRRPRKR